MRKLTDKEELFVAAYVVDLNAMKAARAAGYKHDHKVACKILAREPVQAAIVRAQEEKFKRLEIEADDVIRELVKIGFSDIRKAVRWGRSPVDEKSENAKPNGLGTFPVELVPSEEVDDDTAAAISEVKLTQTGVSIKMLNKQPALESLGKHFGIFEADNHQRVPPNEEVKKSLEDLTPAEAAAEWARMIADV